jgi:hypothetical protein
VARSDGWGMSKTDSVEGGEDRLHHGIGARQDIVVPEAQDREAFALEKCIASRVVRRGFDVLAAVELDDQPGLQAGEIGDVRSDGDLASEAGVEELPAAQAAPQSAFRFSQVAPEGAGMDERCSGCSGSHRQRLGGNHGGNMYVVVLPRGARLR